MLVEALNGNIEEYELLDKKLDCYSVPFDKGSVTFSANITSTKEAYKRAVAK
jgi:hypothetical protein